MTLEEIRRRIDTIDEQLLPLFTARMECARQVAEIKLQKGLPVLNPQREQEIQNRMASRAGEYAGEARVLYGSLMDMSRARQHVLLGGGEELRTQVSRAPQAPENAQSIACLGKPGSYSHQAARQLYPQGELCYFNDFAGIFQAVESGEADLGVVPVENSSAGSVGDVYDLILKTRFSIIAAKTLYIHNCLAAPAACASPLALRRVYSHPQPISQCSNLIAQHGWEAVSCTSTAQAAQLVAQRNLPDEGALCSEEAAQEYGLQVLARDVQNSRNNCTRFIVISRKLCIPENASKISLCFSLPHTTGSLYQVLARFATAGLNLTKIESRPIAGKNFEYDFYLDFTGNVREKATLNLLAALYDELPRFSFLGNYTEEE